MKYISTRGGVQPMGFTDAVATGLAADGGLLIPDHIPDARARLDAWRQLPYRRLAEEIVRLYWDDCDCDLAGMIGRSYAAFSEPDVVPLKRVGDVFVAELFHGPTLSFKDIALQLLGNLFEHILDRSGGRMNVVAATSGDTGSAAICGLRGRRGIGVFVMHPHQRISRLQELQMTTVLDANVHNIAVRGTFDDCQRILKALFNDAALRRECSLAAVNSINWARVLAQMVYYFHAAFRVMDRTGAERVRFAVPTGNFGDILAGYYAARMGLPVGRLVLATNENDILRRFFDSGEYRAGPVHATISPAMDIQVASNFERYLYYRLGEDPSRVAVFMAEFARAGVSRVAAGPGADVDPLFAAGTGATGDTLETLRLVHRQWGYVLDPHTAVGVCVGRRHLHAREPMICLATAHPGKFPDVVAPVAGPEAVRHPVLDGLASRPSRCVVLDARTDDIAAFVRRSLNEPAEPAP